MMIRRAAIQDLEQIMQIYAEGGAVYARVRQPQPVGDGVSVQDVD